MQNAVITKHIIIILTTYLFLSSQKPLSESWMQIIDQKQTRSMRHQCLAEYTNKTLNLPIM